MNSNNKFLDYINYEPKLKTRSVPRVTRAEATAIPVHPFGA